MVVIAPGIDAAGAAAAIAGGLCSG